MAYQYITDNNLYHKQSYMYSEYSGIKFLKDYVSSRQKYLNQRRVDESQIKDNCIQTYSRGTEALSDTMKDLLELRNQLRAGHVEDRKSVV